MVVSALSFPLSSRDELSLHVVDGCLPYQLDRDACVKALNAARGTPTPVAEPVEEQGESA